MYIKCYHRKEASSLWQQPLSNYFPNVIREHTCFFTSKVVSKLPTGRYFFTRIIINIIYAKRAKNEVLGHFIELGWFDWSDTDYENTK